MRLSTIAIENGPTLEKLVAAIAWGTWAIVSFVSDPRCVKERRISNEEGSVMRPYSLSIAGVWLVIRHAIILS